MVTANKLGSRPLSGLSPRSVLLVGLRALRSRVTRVAFLVLVLGLGGYAVWVERQEFLASTAQMGPVAIALAAAATALHLTAATLAWRAVLSDYGHPLPLTTSLRVFLVGQLGKYLPGSVWNVVAQSELGADLGVPRSRTASASVVALAVSIATGSLMALSALALLPGLDSLRWLAVAAPLLLVTLYPPVLERVIGLGLRLLGRKGVAPRLSTRGLLVTLWWSLLAWLLLAVQILLLTTAAGAEPDGTVVIVAVLGFPLAWLVGFLVIISPAGVGPREAALVLVLAPVLDTGAALAVALVSRVLMSLLDFVAAGAAVLLDRRHRRTRHP